MLKTRIDRSLNNYYIETVFFIISNSFFKVKKNILTHLPPMKFAKNIKI